MKGLLSYLCATCAAFGFICALISPEGQSQWLLQATAVLLLATIALDVSIMKEQRRGQR